MRRTLHCVTLFIVLLFTFGSGMAGGGQMFDLPPSGDRVLRIGVAASDIGTFDPHFSASYQDRAVADMVFNGLVRYKPGEAPEIEPDLVESIPDPELVDGRQMWTFKLRKGVMFHPCAQVPSYELTSDDVVYSLHKSADPKRSAYAGEYENMVVEKIDDHTVRISLDRPLSPVLFLPKISNYAGGFIVSKRVIELLGDGAFTRHPVGTGPFMLADYRPNEKASLLANPVYFRGRPKLDRVELHFYPDVGMRESAFLNGSLDVIYGFKSEAVFDKMNGIPNILVDTHGVGEVAVIHFNTSVKPFDDRRVRQAVAYAIDRDKCLDLFVRKIADNVYSPVPSQLLPGGLSRAEVEELNLDYGLDRDKARHLMAQAGYANGFDLKVYSSSLSGYLKNYQSIRDQLAFLGINMKIEVVDHSTMHSLIRQNLNALVVYIAWRPNADACLTRFFHSDSIVSTGTTLDTNFSHYDQVDDLIEDARWEANTSRQIELWKLAQIKILSDMAAFPLHYQNLVHLRKKYVDYGHPLKSSLALYPQITERTRINRSAMSGNR